MRSWWGWLWQVLSVQFTQILQKTSPEKFCRRAREALKSAALKPQIMTPQGPIYRPFTMQDEPIKEWRCRATLTKLNRKPKRRSTTRGSALVDEATGGLDMTLDQDYNVAIWSAFIHGHEGGGLPHRAKPKLIYAMSVLPLGSYLAFNSAAQYLAKAPAEQSSAVAAIS